MALEISIFPLAKIEGIVIVLLQNVKSSIFKVEILCKDLSVLVLICWQYVVVGFTEFLGICQ